MIAWHSSGQPEPLTFSLYWSFSMGSPPIPAGDPAHRHEKVAAFVSRSAAAAETKPASAGATDHLDAFGSEDDEPRGSGFIAGIPGAPRDMRPVWIGVAVAGGLALLVAAVVFGPALFELAPGQGSARPGRVTLGTTPAGAEVSVDGQVRGLTPLSLQLDPGAHEVKLQRGTDERTISIQVASGAEISQHYEFAPPPPASASTSTLSVITEPP